MRFLVTSDTHGDVMSLRRAILAQPQAELVIHLGDGEGDVSLLKPTFSERMFLQVQGNCDWGSALPVRGEFEAQGVKLFYTHGHAYGVKSGDGSLLAAAREREARIVLYGHTHLAREDYQDGMYIMNPGRLSGWEPSYGTIDITEQGILLNIVKLPC